MTTDPAAAFRTGLMLLSQSGVKGRLSIDLDLKQIQEAIFWFGGFLELTRPDDDEAWLTYTTKVENIDVAAHLSISNLIYCQQFQALSGKIAVFEAGTRLTITDGYFVV